MLHAAAISGFLSILKYEYECLIDLDYVNQMNRKQIESLGESSGESLIRSFLISKACQYANKILINSLRLLILLYDFS